MERDRRRGGRRRGLGPRRVRVRVPVGEQNEVAVGLSRVAQRIGLEVSEALWHLFSGEAREPAEKGDDDRKPERGEAAGRARRGGSVVAALARRVPGRGSDEGRGQDERRQGEDQAERRT